MSDKLWRAVYDRFHKPQTDPEKKKENVERYHAMVKIMVAIERQNLLQIAEDKNFLNKAPRLHRDVPRCRPHRGFEYNARRMARPMDQ